MSIRPLTDSMTAFPSGIQGAVCHFSVLSETDVRGGKLCVAAKNVQGLLFRLKPLQSRQRVPTPPPRYLEARTLMLNCVKTEAGGRHPTRQEGRELEDVPRLFTCAAAGKMSPF